MKAREVHDYRLQMPGGNKVEWSKPRD